MKNMIYRLKGAGTDETDGFKRRLHNLYQSVEIITELFYTSYCSAKE